jgi:hypothetical protein
MHCVMLSICKVIRATAIPGIARLAFGRDIVDRLKLPNYRWRHPCGPQ